MAYPIGKFDNDDRVKFAAIGQLTAGILHDFNNIFGAARLFADMIAQKAPPETDEHKYAERIIACCAMATEMIAQVNAFANSGDAKRAQVLVADILDEAGTLLDGLLPSGATLSITNSTSNTAIVANANQLVRVLLNIAVNAGDAIAGRAGQVSISVDDVMEISREPNQTATEPDGAAGAFSFATAALNSDASYVRFSVADTGSGIPRHIAAKIFEHFFTTKDKDRGLGLSIAKNIVDAHGGVIVVHSRVGQGTQFDVYLPVFAPQLRGPQPVAPCRIISCPHGGNGCVARFPVSDD